MPGCSALQRSSPTPRGGALPPASLLIGKREDKKKDSLRHWWKWRNHQSLWKAVIPGVTDHLQKDNSFAITAMQPLQHCPPLTHDPGLPVFPGCWLCLAAHCFATGWRWLCHHQGRVSHTLQWRGISQDPLEIGSIKGVQHVVSVTARRHFPLPLPGRDGLLPGQADRLEGHRRSCR